MAPPDPDMVRDMLIRQFTMASELLHYHLEGLTTEECLWRPAPTGLHVHSHSDGPWAADWPEGEDYAIGPPTIAWVTWHLGYWLTMALDHNFGSASRSRSAIFWPGNAAKAVDWICRLEDRWRRQIAALDEPALRSDAKTKWPFTGRPLADVVAWSTVELTKNAAEIGYVRFLYAGHHR